MNKSKISCNAAFLSFIVAFVTFVMMFVIAVRNTSKLPQGEVVAENKVPGWVTICKREPNELFGIQTVHINKEEFNKAAPEMFSKASVWTEDMCLVYSLICTSGPAPVNFKYVNGIRFSTNPFFSFKELSSGIELRSDGKVYSRYQPASFPAVMFFVMFFTIFAATAAFAAWIIAWLSANLWGALAISRQGTIQKQKPGRCSSPRKEKPVKNMKTPNSNCSEAALGLKRGKTYRFDPPVQAGGIPTAGLNVHKVVTLQFDRGCYLGLSEKSRKHVFQGKPVNDPRPVPENLRGCYFHVEFTGGSRMTEESGQNRSSA